MTIAGLGLDSLDRRELGLQRSRCRPAGLACLLAQPGNEGDASAAIALWFANGWYLNARLKSVHAKLDSALNQFNGFREYLYEINSQFDDEREFNERVEEHKSAPDSHDMFAGMNDMELIREKAERK